MATPDRLSRKPEARTLPVEQLVQKVLDGGVRIPDFQRILKWESSHVVQLLDSIYRGYPIGALLFYKKKGPAEVLQMGPLTIEAPELTEAWWVVDGQQRLAALTASLAHPLPLPERPRTADPFVVYFNTEDESFEPPPNQGDMPSTWVPLPVLLEASHLSEWIFGWDHAQDAKLRGRVFEAGARIREYTIPLYLIDAAAGESEAKEIFYRVNQSGKPLDWKEVHDALFGAGDSEPSSLESLADALEGVGMGRLSENRLLTCLMAMRRLDPTRTLPQHREKDPDAMEGAAAEALPVLRQVLSFLRRDASIPHLRLLPKSILLDVLTRFFHLHPDPKQRSRMLLARWYWRAVLGAVRMNERTLRRQGTFVVTEDEERSVQGLLALLYKERPRDYELPSAFDARADASRLALLALTHLRPRSLESGEPIDVPALITEREVDAFVKLIENSKVEGNRSPANRVIHPRCRGLRGLIESETLASEAVLASHAIDGEAVRHLAAGEEEAFLVRRAEVLTEHVRQFVERQAAWDQNDRPSVEHILAEAGVEA